MLGYRKIYPSTAVHATCVLKLEDDPANPEGEVLLAAKGNSLDVYAICPDPLSSGVPSLSTHESRNAAAAFKPMNQSFLVGTSVIALAPFRHQMFAIWTRELDLLLVRYQANLSSASSYSHSETSVSNMGSTAAAAAAASSSTDGLTPAWRHWCVCARYSLDALRMRGMKRSAHVHRFPYFFCDPTGTIMVAGLFDIYAFGLHVALPGESNLAGYFSSCWRNDLSTGVPDLMAGSIHPADPAKSINHELALSHDRTGGEVSMSDWQAKRAEVLQRWEDDTDDYADEDLFLDHSVEALTAKKQGVYSHAVERERQLILGELHDPEHIPLEDESGVRRGSIGCVRAPKVHCALTEFSRAAYPVPFARPTSSDEDSVGARLRVLTCLPPTDRRNLTLSVAEMTDSLEVSNVWQKVISHGLGYAPPVVVNLVLSFPMPTDDRQPTNGAAGYHSVLFCRGGDVHYMLDADFQLLHAGNDRDAPNFKLRMRPLAKGPAAIADGLTLIPTGSEARPPQIWLLLSDGSFTSFPYEKDPPGWEVDERLAWRLTDGVCKGVPWHQSRLTGLPATFHPARMEVVDAADAGCQQNKVTRRYALLHDSTGTAILIDLVLRRVVGQLGGPGALASACGGPAGTDDLFIAHANGLVCRLSPAIPLQITASEVLPDDPLVAVARADAAGQPWLVAPLPLVLAAGTAARTTVRSRVVVCVATGECERGTNTESMRLPVARPVAAGALCVAHCGPLLLWCTAQSVFLQSPSETATLAADDNSSTVQSVRIPGKATHAAACTAESLDGDAVTGFVVALLEDGCLVVVQTAAFSLTTGIPTSPAQGGDSLRCSKVPVPPAVRIAKDAGITFIGAAHVQAHLDKDRGNALAVPIGSWDGCVRFFTLQTDWAATIWTMTSVADAEQGEASMMASYVFTNPDELDYWAVPTQLVAAPRVNGRAIWLVRTTSGTVSVLTADHTGQCTWQRLRYTTRPHAAGSADESRAVTATLLGEMSVEGKYGSDRATLGVGRSGALLIHAHGACSLLFFSLPSPRPVENGEGCGEGTAGPPGQDTNTDDGVRAPLVEEEVRFHLEDAAGSHSYDGHNVSFEWRGGCVVAHRCHPSSVLDSFTVHIGHRGWLRSAVVSSSMLGFVPHHTLTPDLTQRQRQRQQQQGPEGWELAVRTAPSYRVIASSQCLDFPEDCPITTVYSAVTDTLLAVTRTNSRDSAGLRTLEGTRLEQVETLTVEGHFAVCAAAVPYAASLPPARETLQDLVVMGTCPTTTDGRASLLLVSTQPLCVKAVRSLGEAGTGASVMDVAVQRHRGRAGLNIRSVACATTSSDSDPEDLDRQGKEEEMIVAACCGHTVHVLLLTGITLHPLATFMAYVPCLSLSLCYPFVSVGCGTGGNLILQLRDKNVTRDAAPREDETGSSESGEWTDAATDSAAGSVHGHGDEDRDESNAAGSFRHPHTHTHPSSSGGMSGRAGLLETYPQRSMQLLRVGLELAMHGTTINQTSFRDTHVVRTDMDASVVFSRIDYGDASTGKPPKGMALVGTDQSPGFTEIFHCVRLPSPVTSIGKAVGERSGDGHAAVWRRRRRQFHWTEYCTTLRTTSARTDGGGPVQLLLPCQDGSLYAIQELPWSFAHPLQLLEQCYTDLYSKYLAPARLWPSPLSRKGPTDCERGQRTKQTFHSIPFRASQAVHNAHRTLQRQGMISLDAVEEVFRLAALSTTTTTDKGASATDTVVAELSRILKEDYGTEVSFAECQEICSAW